MNSNSPLLICLAESVFITVPLGTIIIFLFIIETGPVPAVPAIEGSIKVSLKKSCVAKFVMPALLAKDLTTEAMLLTGPN